MAELKLTELEQEMWDLTQEHVASEMEHADELRRQAVACQERARIRTARALQLIATAHGEQEIPPGTEVDDSGPRLVFRWPEPDPVCKEAEPGRGLPCGEPEAHEGPHRWEIGQEPGNGTGEPEAHCDPAFYEDATGPLEPQPAGVSSESEGEK